MGWLLQIVQGCYMDGGVNNVSHLWWLVSPSDSSISALAPCWELQRWHQESITDEEKATRTQRERDRRARKSANEDSHTEYFKGSIGGKQNIPSSFPNGLWGACHQEACALGQTSPSSYSCFPSGEQLWGFTQKCVQYDHVLMRKTAWCMKN